jgi:hypothetical protein
MDSDDGEINGNVIPQEAADIEGNVGGNVDGNRDRPQRAGGPRDGRRRSRGGRNRNGGGARGENGPRRGPRNPGDGAHAGENGGPQTANVSSGSSEPASHAQGASQAAPQVEHHAAASNDAAPPARDYERVNEVPAAKKKGWWNKLTE